MYHKTHSETWQVHKPQARGAEGGLALCTVLWTFVVANECGLNWWMDFKWEICLFSSVPSAPQKKREGGRGLWLPGLLSGQQQLILKAFCMRNVQGQHKRSHTTWGHMSLSEDSWLEKLKQRKLFYTVACETGMERDWSSLLNTSDFPFSVTPIPLYFMILWSFIKLTMVIYLLVHETKYHSFKIFLPN